MIISQITSRKLLEDCVDMYLALNDENFLPASRDLAIKRLDLLVRRKRYVRVLTNNSTPIAWLYADISDVQHCNKRIIQQNYYASNTSGVLAYKCVKLLHEDLISYAIEKRFQVIISPGSHMDPDNTFARILEKLGWERRHYIALYKTPLYFEN